MSPNKKLLNRKFGKRNRLKRPRSKHDVIVTISNPIIAKNQLEQPTWKATKPELTARFLHVKAQLVSTCYLTNSNAGSTIDFFLFTNTSHGWHGLVSEFNLYQSLSMISYNQKCKWPKQLINFRFSLYFEDEIYPVCGDHVHSLYITFQLINRRVVWSSDANEGNILLSKRSETFEATNFCWFRRIFAVGWGMFESDGMWGGQVGRLRVPRVIGVNLDWRVRHERR